MKEILSVEAAELWHVAVDNNRLSEQLTDAQVIQFTAQYPECEILIWKKGEDDWLPPNQANLAHSSSPSTETTRVHTTLPPAEGGSSIIFDRNKALFGLQIVVVWMTLMVFFQRLPGDQFSPENATRWSFFWLISLTWLGWQILAAGCGHLIRLEASGADGVHWRNAWDFVKTQMLSMVWTPILGLLILHLAPALVITRIFDLAGSGKNGYLLAGLAAIPLFCFLIATIFLICFAYLTPIVMGLQNCNGIAAAREIYYRIRTQPDVMVLGFLIGKVLPAVFFTQLLISSLTSLMFFILNPSFFLRMSGLLFQTAAEQNQNLSGFFFYGISSVVIQFAVSCSLFIYFSGQLTHAFQKSGGLEPLGDHN